MHRPEPKRLVVDVVCPSCSRTFKTWPSKLEIGRGKHCSKACMAATFAKRRGELSPSWKGGVIVHPRDGRVRVRRPEHPSACSAGYVLRARLVMEAHLGRYLGPDELIHHRDEDPSNDAIDNLELVSRGEHNKIHGFQGNCTYKFERIRHETIGN